ncbi:MAG: AMP-binding protein, partial [Sphingopyxis sp.]
MSLPQVCDVLCAPGAKFEMETRIIRGVATRTWKNAPASLIALLQLAQTHADRTFIIYEGERVSYTAFYRATAAFAAELARRGVGRGDRVALAMRNLPEWPVVFFAAVSLGAIVVPLNAWWTGAELEYALADSGTQILVCDAERMGRIAP